MVKVAHHFPNVVDIFPDDQRQFLNKNFVFVLSDVSTERYCIGCFCTFGVFVTLSSKRCGCKYNLCFDCTRKSLVHQRDYNSETLGLTCAMCRTSALITSKNEVHLWIVMNLREQSKKPNTETKNIEDFHLLWNKWKCTNIEEMLQRIEAMETEKQQLQQRILELDQECARSHTALILSDPLLFVANKTLSDDPMDQD